MTFLPVVARELRVAARRRSTYSGRVAAALVPIVVAGFWLPILASQFSTSQGKLLFSALSFLAFGYCLFAGTRVTSDCLSAEKREGTIGLLFLTDLQGYDVVLGKLVSCSLHAFYGLLAIVPVLALALVFGGVTLAEVSRMAMLFVNTLFFSMAAGVIVSTLSRDDRRAMFATAFVILLVTAGPYALTWGYIMSQWMQFGRGPNSLEELANWLKVSPVFAFQMARQTILSPSMAQDFYHSIALTHALSWTFLTAASVLVPRVCRERPPGRLGLRWLNFRNRWSYGKPVARQAFRARLLDQNAFYWLAARDRIKAYYVWFFILSLALIWTWSGWMMKSFIFDWDVSFWLLFLLFVFLKVWLASEVCTRLVEDRTSGAFELLLSSPLTLKEIARGQSLATWRQFGRPIVVALLLTCLLLVSALRSPHYGMAAGEIKLLFWTLMIMLVADAITLKWVGIWHAVNTSQINRATLATCARVLFLPSVLFLAVYTLWLLLSYATGRSIENPLGWRRACELWLIIGLANDLFFGWRARWRFLHHFRDIATQRFAPQHRYGEPLAQILRPLLQRLWPGPRSAHPLALGKRWLILGSALLLVVLALASLGYRRHTLTRRVESKLATIRAAAEPLGLAALQSWGPVVSDSENAAVIFRQATTPLMGMLVPKVGAKKMEWPAPGTPLTPEFKKVLSEFLLPRQALLELLHDGAKLRKSRHQIEWRNMPFHAIYWQVFAGYEAARDSLQYEALFHAEAGDAERALRSVETLLGMAHALGQEPILAAQHHRLGCLRAAVRVLERIANRPILNGEQMRSVSRSMHEAELETGPALARAFIGQRSLDLEEMMSPRQAAGWGPPPPTGLQKLAADAASSTAGLLGMRERLLLQYLQSVDRVIARSRHVGSQDAIARAGLDPIVRAPGDSTAAARIAMFEQYWEDVLVSHIETVLRLQAAQVGLAIEQFKRTNQGRLPQTLDQLTPTFLSRVPVDPFSTGPLRFQRLDDGYSIYSIGRDRHDNGGAEQTDRTRAQPVAGYDPSFTIAADLISLSH